MGLTKKQHSVLKYIVDYSNEHGYAPTQREIKEAFELKSYGSVQRYLKYLKEAGFLSQDWNSKRGLSLSEKAYDKFESSNSKNHMSSSQGPSYQQDNFIELPLLGDVAAGIPIEALENPDNTIQIPHHMLSGSGRHFALSVCGDSMIEDGILDGDMAIIKHQNSALNGQRVVALIEGEATLKKYFKRSDHIELLPANTNMSPIIVESDRDFKIAGLLVGLFRNYN